MDRMKQLLDSCGCAVIVGLRNMVYVAIPSTSSDGGSDLCNRGSIFSRGFRLVSLLPPTNGTGILDKPLINKAEGDEVTSKEGEDGEEETAISHSERDANEIQAVSCFHLPVNSLDSSGRLICVVSRYNKTISVYVISLNDDACATSTRPIMVHMSVKRACSLSLTSLHHKLDMCSLVVIGGDLSGDVTAYPVMTKSASDECTVHQHDTNDLPSQSVSRVLLGHTGSMITGVKIAQDCAVAENGISIPKLSILTSDRDEKIRVSSFPETYMIEGYLLGHTAFVSSMDVAGDPGCYLCLSCGGEGMIRLWDYDRCEEMSTFDYTDDVKSTENVINLGKAVDQSTGQNEQNEIDHRADVQTEAPMPFHVALRRDGRVAAVACAGSKKLDLFMISVPNRALRKVKSVHCAEQPLSVKFLDDEFLCVLAASPAYVLLFKIIQIEKNSTNLFVENMTETTKLCKIFRDEARRSALILSASTVHLDDNERRGLLKVKSPNFVSRGQWNSCLKKARHKERQKRRHQRRHEEF